MTTESFLQRVIDSWFQLRDLLGVDWGTFRHSIHPLGAKLRSNTDPLQQATIVAELKTIFASYPACRPWLDDVLQSSVSEVHTVEIERLPVRTRGSVRTRGGAPAVADSQRAAAPPSLPSLVGRLAGLIDPRTITRYTDVNCPRRVWIGAARFQVSVRLTAKPCSASSDLQSLPLEAGQPVDVCIDAPGLDVLNQAEQRIVVPDQGDSPPVVFDLRPREIGYVWVKLDFMQGTNLLGSSSLPVECVPFNVPLEPNGHPGPLLTWDTDSLPPDLLLHIAWYDSPHSAPALQYRLWEGSQCQVFAQFASKGNRPTTQENIIGS